MSILGEKYTVVYESKNFKSGILGITTKIQKPNGSFVGPIALSEYADIFFKGVYFAEFMTTISDPVGEWVGVISSPNEGNHKQAYRASFQSATPDIDVQSIVDGVWDELITNHLGQGSTGEALNILNSLDIDVLLAKLLISDITVKIEDDEPIEAVVSLEEQTIFAQFAQDEQIFVLITDEENISNNVETDAEIIGVLND